MRNYLIFRLLLFVPTTMLIGVFSFYLFKSTPNDPVASLLTLEGFNVENVSLVDYKQEYMRLSKSLDLHLPNFYFSIVPSYFPDTLHRIIEKRDKEVLIDLMRENNDWGLVKAYFDSSKKLSLEISNKGNSISKELAFDIDFLLYKTSVQDLKSEVVNLKSKYANSADENVKLFQQHLGLATKVTNGKTSFLAFPKFIWHGADSQFHKWYLNFIKGKLGKSIVDGRAVSTKLYNSLSWTASLVLISMLLAVLISIPIGIWSARKDDSFFDKIVSNIFYSIYAIPIFWFATLMVVFFTTQDYGAWTNIFPNVGLRPGVEDSVFQNIISNARQLILPVLCLVINSVAYLSRLTKSSLQSESTKLYNTTAQAKGLLLKSAFRKHLFPNALLPLITILAGAIPASLAGSLVIEVIFNIPGIGRLMYDSIFSNDWYVIFSIVMLIGIITMIFYLVGDVLYSYANPKVRFGKSKN